MTPVCALVAAMLTAGALAVALGSTAAARSGTAAKSTIVGAGYWMLGRDGVVYGFGASRSYPGKVANAKSIAPKLDGSGYWIVNSVGSVHAYGSSQYRGRAPRLKAGESITTMSATRSGKGYWLFSNRGRAFAYGDAGLHGDLAKVALNGAIIASVATPTGRGYFMIGDDGGIFAFGDARFLGSMGDHRLAAPIVGMAPTPSNHGYWLVGSDGGVFAFGDARFRGSMGSTRLNQPIDGIVAFGNGYLMVASDGGVFDFSNQPFLGSMSGKALSAPITAIAALTPPNVGVPKELPPPPTTTSTSTTTVAPITSTSTTTATTTTTTRPSTTTTTVPQQGGQICNAPYASTISAAYTDPNHTTWRAVWQVNATTQVRMEVWGPDQGQNAGAWSQTNHACSASSWNSIANFPAPPQTQTYPDTAFTMCSNQATCAAAPTVAQYTSMPTCFTEQSPGGPNGIPSAWDGDWGYDNWLARSDGSSPFTYEIMVWNRWNGGAYPPSNARQVTIGGVTWREWQQSSTEWIYTPITQTDSNCIDMKPILVDAASVGAMGTSGVNAHPNMLTYGAEINHTNGTQRFDLTRLTFTPTVGP